MLEFNILALPALFGCMCCERWFVLCLALRAEKNASLPQFPGPNRGSADATGLAISAINIERKLEVSGFAVTVAKVAQGGAAGPEGTIQCGAYGRGHPFVLCPADAASGTRGPQTGPEQRLVCVNVADAGDDLAVEQKITDRAFTTA